MVRESEDDEKVIDYSPSQEKPIKSMWTSVFATFVITWLFMIAGGVYLHGEIQKYSNSDFGVENSKKIADKIAKLQQDLDAISRQVSDNKSVAKKIDSMEEKIATIPDEFPDAGEIPAIYAGNAEFGDLKEQLEELEEKVEENSQLDAELSKNDRMTPIVIATINLRERVSKGLSYDSDLAVLKDLSHNDDIMADYLSKLEKNLGEELPGLDILQERFSAIAGKVVVDSKGGDNKDDFWNNTLIALSDSVTVRRVGNVEGDTLEALIARAEIDVKKGNISRATKTLSGVSDSSNKLLQEWLADAKKYVEIEALFADMYNHVTRLSASDSISSSDSDTIPGI